MQNSNLYTWLKRFFSVFFFVIFLVFFAQAQELTNAVSATDSLSLDEILTQVLQNHPVIKKAEEALNQADAGMGLAKSGYYPNIDASVSVSNVGPVPELTVPNMGSFKLFPDNNFSAAINIQQNVYDFGKTASRVSFAGMSKDIIEEVIKQTKQNLAIAVIMNYYSLVYFQQAVAIKDLQLETLNQHLEFVKKRQATGSGTQYEVLNTQVKISVAENQKLDLTAGREKQLAVLNALLGQPAKTAHLVKNKLELQNPEFNDDSLINQALENRTDMQIAQKSVDKAQMHLNIVKTTNRPSLNFLASGGLKNGYVPDINKIKPNYMVGLGLRVPIFDATRQKYNVLMAQSQVESSNLETQILERNISGEVIENEINMETAREKVKQTQLQLSQAEEAFKLAGVNYDAGAITNLELLDVTTMVSESKLMVVKSQIDYILSIYKFEMSMGELLYN